VSVSEWVSEWVSVSEWVGECVCVCVCVSDSTSGRGEMQKMVQVFSQSNPVQGIS
jgi:hypothetical protein